MKTKISKKEWWAIILIIVVAIITNIALFGLNIVYPTPSTIDFIHLTVWVALFYGALYIFITGITIPSIKCLIRYLKQ
jgi:hypothetical protein